MKRNGEWVRHRKYGWGKVYQCYIDPEGKVVIMANMVDDHCARMFRPHDVKWLRRPGVYLRLLRCLRDWRMR